jgi:serine/threonine protein kinase
LHDSKVRHKDIKPRNILIKGETVLLTDFGLARDWEDTTGGQSTTFNTIPPFTPTYCAPEVADEEPRNSASDVWSLGCVFLQMLTVLKGIPLDSIDTFLSNNGSCSQHFWKNPTGTALWMAHLKLSAGLRSDNSPISWIQGMLQHGHRERPAAKTVFEWTKDLKLPLHPRVPFCGSCCCGDDTFDDTVVMAENHLKNPRKFAGGLSADMKQFIEDDSQTDVMQIDPPLAKTLARSVNSDGFPEINPEIGSSREGELVSEMSTYFGMPLAKVRKLDYM